MLKSAAVLRRLQAVPTWDWCASLPLGPFQGLASSAASGALSPGVSRGGGSLGLRQTLRPFRLVSWHLGCGGHQGGRASCSISYWPLGWLELVRLPVKPDSSRMQGKISSLGSGNLLFAFLSPWEVN